MDCKSKKYLHIYDWNYWWGYPVKELCIPGQFKAVGDVPCAMSFFTVCLPWGVCFARCALAILRPTARTT